MTQQQPGTALPPPPQAAGGCARWALGCGVTVLIVLAIGAGVAWWFVGRPLVAAFQSVQELEQIGSLEQRLANRQAFVPPADGALTENQVERLLTAQERMQSDLSARAERLQRLLEEFDARPAEGVDVVLLAQTYAEMLRLVVEAVAAQSAALDAQGFSAGEYAWVRREVLRAAGLPFEHGDVDGFVGALTGGGPDLGSAGPATAVPDANRALIERYRERLDETAFLALLGL